MQIRLVGVIVMLAGSAWAACATRRDPSLVPQKPTLIVLLPDADTGMAGRIRVANEFGAVELGAARAATTATPGSRPEPVRTISEAEVKRLFGAALAALPPAPLHFTLRFRFESDELTEESSALIPQILKAVKDMPFPEVAVIGHTDTLGDSRANVALGMKRATSVRSLLVGVGIDGSTIATSSHGEGDLLIKTQNNTPEPRNRRVEIVVR